MHLIHKVFRRKEYAIFWKKTCSIFCHFMLQGQTANILFIIKISVSTGVRTFAKCLCKKTHWCYLVLREPYEKQTEWKAIFIPNLTNLTITDSTFPTPILQGAVQELWTSQNLAPRCDAKCISSITSPNCYCTACIHTAQGLRGLGRDSYSSHHLLATARCSPHGCLQNS